MLAGSCTNTHLEEFFRKCLVAKIPSAGNLAAAQAEETGAI